MNDHRWLRNWNKINFLTSFSRSGKDAIFLHRGCINSILGQSFEKIYYRNDPVKYDLDLYNQDDTIYNQFYTLLTTRTRLTVRPSIRKNLKLIFNIHQEFYLSLSTFQLFNYFKINKTFRFLHKFNVIFT